MPIYMCNYSPDIIRHTEKQKLARDIARIHSNVTGAPENFVHVFFFEGALNQKNNGREILLFGTIGAGRTPDQKANLLKRLRHSIHLNTSASLGEIIVATNDIPSNWLMTGGDIIAELI